MVQFHYQPIKNNFFSLLIQQKTAETYLKMQLVSPNVNTFIIPQTKKILTDLLPDIHASECFNTRKLPFAEEVTHTEIGHLFEHILLEYIYQSKIAHNNYSESVNGETSWNWEKDAPGIFHITVNIGLRDAQFLLTSIKKSIKLVEKILQFDPYFKS